MCGSIKAFRAVIFDLEVTQIDTEITFIRHNPRLGDVWALSWIRRKHLRSAP